MTIFAVKKIIMKKFPARNLEHLLATIFQPQNAYCIHIDPKVSENFQFQNQSYRSCINSTNFDCKADPMFLKTVEQLISCYRFLKNYYEWNITFNL